MPLGLGIGEIVLLVVGASMFVGLAAGAGLFVRSLIARRGDLLEDRVRDLEHRLAEREERERLPPS